MQAGAQASGQSWPPWHVQAGQPWQATSAQDDADWQGERRDSAQTSWGWQVRQEGTLTLRVSAVGRERMTSLSVDQAAACIKGARLAVRVAGTRTKKA